MLKTVERLMAERMIKMFEVGDVVRYTEKWSTPNERKYIFTVLEKRFNESDPFRRYLIGCLNSNLYFGSTEQVEEEMIELLPKQ